MREYYAVVRLITCLSQAFGGEREYDANKFPPTTNTESRLIDGHLCSCDVLITEISPLFE